jgi:hypothetical protein
LWGTSAVCRARITIDVSVSQLPACFPAEPSIWRIRTAAFDLAPPISHSRSCDQHRLARLPVARPKAVDRHRRRVAVQSLLARRAAEPASAARQLSRSRRRRADPSRAAPPRFTGKRRS